MGIDYGIRENKQARYDWRSIIIHPFLITARLCFSRHLLSDRIDMITFNSPFRKGKVEVVVAWTSSLDFSERSTPLPPFFNRSYTKRGGLSGWTLTLNFRRNNKLFRNNCEIRDVAFHSRKQFPRCSNVTRDSFDSLTTPSTLFFSSLPIQTIGSRVRGWRRWFVFIVNRRCRRRCSSQRRNTSFDPAARESMRSG